MTMRFIKIQRCRGAVLLVALFLSLSHLFPPCIFGAYAQSGAPQVSAALSKSESLLNEFIKSLAAARRSPSEEGVRRVRDAAAQVREVAESLQGYLSEHEGSAQAPLLRERMEALREYLKMEKPPDERDIFQYPEVEKPARVTHKPVPNFTEEARQAKLSGTVRVRVVLAADGSVKHVVPVEPLGHGLTEEAIKAVRGVRFEPAMRKGRAVSLIAQFEYNFNI